MFEERELSLIEEQTVRSARFAHQLLLTACLASIVFVFSPTENNVYQSAVREMNVLLSVDLERLFFPEAMKDESFSGQHKKLSQILADYGISLADNTHDNNAVLQIEPQRPSFAGMSLEEASAYATNLSQLKLRITVIDENLEIAIRGFIEENRSQVEKWGSAAYVGTFNDNLSFGFFNPQNRQAGVAGTGAKLRSPTKVENKEIPINILARIYQNPETSAIVSRINGDYLFLPKTREIWDQVRTENPIQARAILARKDAPQEKKLEVFGLSIPQRLIFWTIPAVIFALAINLFLHANNLYGNAKANPKIVRYPWTMLMPGTLAKVALISTAVILPIITSAGAIITTWTSQTTALRIIAIVLCIGTVVALIKSGLRIHNTRNIMVQHSK